MSLSKLRVEANVDQPKGAKPTDVPDSAKPTAPSAPSPHTDQPVELPPWRPRRAPWLVRNSRMVMIAVLLLAAAGVTYTYFYLQRTFAPSPFDGVTRDAVNRAAITGAPEEQRFNGSVGLITSVPKADRSRQSIPPANPVATPQVPPTTAANQRVVVSNGAGRAPSAKSMAFASTLGATQPRVTHTHLPPVADKAPEVGPRAIVSHDQPSSPACADAVAALGLCKPQANTEVR